MCRRRQNGSGPRVLADSSPNAEQKADAYHRETNCPVEMRFVEHLGEIPRPKRDGSGQISFAGYLVDRGLKRGVARFHGRVRHKFVVEQSNSTYLSMALSPYFSGLRYKLVLTAYEFCHPRPGGRAIDARSPHLCRSDEYARRCAEYRLNLRTCRQLFAIGR